MKTNEFRLHNLITCCNNDILQIISITNIDFEFIEADTLKIEIEETDLLFIDTLHTEKQLKQELKLHAGKARKYIVLHDTFSCSDELLPVIEEFLKQGRWKIKADYKNNNGMMILEKC